MLGFNLYWAWSYLYARKWFWLAIDFFHDTCLFVNSCHAFTRNDSTVIKSVILQHCYTVLGLNRSAGEHFTVVV